MEWTERDEFARQAAADGRDPAMAWFVYPIREQLQEFADRMREVVLPSAERVLNVLRAVYREEGEPLGSGDDAMFEWMRWQRDLEDALPEKYPLTDDEEDAWDDLVQILDD